MAARFQSALSRRERIWPAALVSALLHVGVIAFAMVRASGPELDLDQKPIVAKLVRLGEERPKTLLPRKEPPPPPPAAAEPAPVPVPVPVPTQPTAPAPAPAVATSRPAPKTAPAPKAAAPKTSAAAGGRSLSSVLDQVRKESAEERWGSPDGDALGDSSEGEGDRYAAIVVNTIKAHYVVPQTIPERELLHLTAELVLTIQPDGQIGAWTFERRSGNASFDAAVERALRQARLPPPPPERRDELRRRGLPVRFRV